ncbi:MAG: dihydroorotate dehydrogenase electron transfer subunit [Candidatus Latescibacterota bacterium]
MREYEADIIRNELRESSTFLIHLRCPELAREARPGQFVQVRVTDGTDPFLRRTFSICGAVPETGTVLLMVGAVGRGTRLLCGMAPGDRLNLIGPLGTAFDLSPGIDRTRVLVAGGVGAAPLVFLEERLWKSGTGNTVFMMGARNAEHLMIIDGLVDLNAKVLFATDDGSWEYHGYVTDLLEEKLPKLNPDIIYACGPHAMLRTVAEIARRAGIPCQVSLEERMACGIGACLGCAIRLADGSMARACKEGPVFNAEDIAW